MQVYDNPYLLPTFIDNHDMARFLASGDLAGLKQALATIFTIPGIPTIYQGTEQAMTESRQAMFKGGFNATRDFFDPSSEMYTFIQRLARLRTSDKLFTRGDFSIIAANNTGPGVLAYLRRYEGRTALIMFNTSRHPILVNGVAVNDKGATLKPMFGSDKAMALDANGNLTTELPGRSIIIAEVVETTEGKEQMNQRPEIQTEPPTTEVTEPLTIVGTSASPKQEILLVKNTRLDTAISVTSDVSGQWLYRYPVVNLGTEQVSIVAYEANRGTASLPFEFTTHINTPELTLTVTDPVNDDIGLNGHYSPPQHSQSIGQLDITGAEIQMGGEVLKLTLTMRELTDEWIPANGFDNVAFSLFFDLPGQQGATTLPLINAKTPSGWDWNLAHVVYGWGNTTFSDTGASHDHQGEKWGVAPLAEVNKSKKSVTFTYRASDFAITQWHGSKIYITTWDITGEGMYRELSPSPSEWSFGGGEKDDPKILDAIEIILPEENTH